MYRQSWLNVNSLNAVFQLFNTCDVVVKILVVNKLEKSAAPEMYNKMAKKREKEIGCIRKEEKCMYLSIKNYKKKGKNRK